MDVVIDYWTKLWGNRRETVEEMTGILLIMGWLLFVGTVIFLSLIPRLIFGEKYDD